MQAARTWVLGFRSGRPVMARVEVSFVVASLARAATVRFTFMVVDLLSMFRYWVEVGPWSLRSGASRSR